jgi:hypothetical protein
VENCFHAFAFTFQLVPLRSRYSTAREQKRESETWFGADPFSRPFRVIVAADGSVSGGTGGAGVTGTQTLDEDGCPPAVVTRGVLTSVARLRSAFAVHRMVETIAVPARVLIINSSLGGTSNVTAQYFTLRDLCSHSRPDVSSSPCLSFSPLGFWPAGADSLAVGLYKLNPVAQ